MIHNHWGSIEFEDDEPFPAWMLAETYRNPQHKPKSKSLNELILEALSKPPVPIIIQEPKGE